MNDEDSLYGLCWCQHGICCSKVGRRVGNRWIILIVDSLLDMRYGGQAARKSLIENRCSLVWVMMRWIWKLQWRYIYLFIYFKIYFYEIYSEKRHFRKYL